MLFGFGLSSILFLSALVPPKLPARDEFQKLCIAQVTKLASINSGSKNFKGVNEVARILKNDFEALGFKVRWNTETRSFTAENKISNPLKTIALVGHIDTVFGADHSFKEVSLVENDARLKDNPEFGPLLFGPGVSDDKGGVFLLLELVKLFKAQDHIHWKIFLQGDEESSSKKSKASLLEFVKGVDLALVFEPGWYDFKLNSPRVGSQVSGSVRATITVNGSEIHPALSKMEGRNANDIAAGIILKFEELRKKGIVVNVFRIVGRSAGNVTTPQSRFSASIRFPKTEDEVYVRRFLDELAGNPFGNEFSVSVDSKWIGKAQRVTEEPLIKLLNAAAKNAGQKPLIPSTTMGRGAGAFLSTEGIPTIDSMGPYGEGFHSNEEVLFVGSAYERLALLRQVVLDFVTATQTAK